MKTFASTFALLLLSSITLCAQGRGGGKALALAPDSLSADAAAHRHHRLGLNVGVDVAGAALATLSSYGTFEGRLRWSLQDTWFPVAELGLGVSDHTDDETHIHYKTSAPFLRLGCDYNFLRDKTSGNRIFAGLRYGFTPFKYDIDSPALRDEVYGTSVPFSFHGLSATSHWAEVVAGVEAEVWGRLHLGWTVRYKLKVSESTTTVGHAWYVPGYGKSGGHSTTGTFHVSIDI